MCMQEVRVPDWVLKRAERAEQRSQANYNEIKFSQPKGGNYGKEKYEKNCSHISSIVLDKHLFGVWGNQERILPHWRAKGRAEL